MAENSSPSTVGKQFLGDFAPKFVELTDRVLFDDVWARPQLPPRDRSLLTCSALIAQGRTDLMQFHFPKALQNGVTAEELVEMITHLAFYVGWPSAMAAMLVARDLLASENVSGTSG